MGIGFGKKIFLSIAGISLLAVLIIAVPLWINASKEFSHMAISKARADALMVAMLSAPSVDFNRSDLAFEILKLLKNSENVVSAVIYVPDFENSVLRHFADYGGAQILPPEFDVLGEADRVTITASETQLIAVTGIYTNDKLLGVLQLVTDVSKFEYHLRQILFSALFASCCALVLAFYLAYTVRQYTVKPIKGLSATAKDIANTHDYSRRAEHRYNDEVGDLIHTFNQMLNVIQRYDLELKTRQAEVEHLNQDLENKVQERTHALHANMQKLSATVQKLETTQSQLAEQQKMAALGSLVSGVAHEINTPIGVAITASSHQSQGIDQLFSAFKEGALTEENFRSALEELEQTNLMVQNNLERAAELVKSFKMVAVDQANDDIREFEFLSFLENILLSLGPELKNTGHCVELDVEEGLILSTSPGALSQIITNLVINSLIHGFETTPNGVIRIQVRSENRTIYLDYTDNGCGVRDDIRQRIFDPFVTSARSKGGTGLGTHILYNLVNQVLKGTVVLMDDTPQGVHFHIEFPQFREESESQKSQGMI